MEEIAFHTPIFQSLHITPKIFWTFFFKKPFLFFQGDGVNDSQFQLNKSSAI